ncbi:hypothetical protein HZY83_05265 [Gemella sp. GH3]|uniref:hypothetical protein n=1 Tax=unclassified Gemella TaxID=2624949 RepID=UPI0015D067ED|nr:MULTISPECIES: hypothetical protein [unclassified Gemella]MBF0714081.1 hypothetical protein [Gemella sp. GH3.1]NYS51033.1 hypothetical protein [Gemella sp. GH3]
MKRNFNKIITIMFSLMLMLIMIALLFFNHLEYSKKNYVSNINIYALIFGSFILFILSFIIKRYLYKFINVYFITVILTLIQIILVYSYYFIPGWDAGIIIDNSFSLFINGELESEYYFSVYPNNISIVNIYYYFISFINFIKLGEYAYFILLVCIILICNVSGILMYKILIKIFQNNVIALIGYAYYILLIYISPWIAIPYSDSLSLILPILMLYIYISLEKYYLKWVLLCFIFAVSISIKPQAAIIFIAIIIFDFLFNTNSIKLFFKKCFTLFIVIIVSFNIINLMNKDIKAKLDKELHTSYIHYLKMGLNENTSGEWNYDDVVFSQSIPLKDDRDYANILVIKERINNFTVSSFLEHYTKKTLLNYSDGTFSWGKEGNFYKEILPENIKISKITRNIYYSDGKYYKYFNFLQQSSWLIILFLSLFSIKFNKNDEETASNYKIIIYMTLIGLFIFLTLFEARGRYLFSNVPIFIICAMYGINNILLMLKKFDILKNRTDK